MAAAAPERELLKRFEVQKFLGKWQLRFSVRRARPASAEPARRLVRWVGRFP